MTTPDPSFFFVHVMKTGGTTFVQNLEANFAPEELYPTPQRGLDRQTAYHMIDELRALTPQERARIRAYAGHFPFVAAELVDANVTMTILRDPVERTVSYLRHCKRYREHMHDMALEDIYEDSWQYSCYIHNYESKLFAMTRYDKLESHLDAIDMDDARLGVAIANLERVDVLGLNDRYEEFVDEIHRRYGWHVAPTRKLQVSTEDWDVSASFRDHIAADNAADVAFYERAREIHAQRHQAV